MRNHATTKASNILARIVRRKADAIIGFRETYQDKVTPTWVDAACAEHAIESIAYAEDILAIDPRYKEQP